jgi:hypothetical protein
VSSWPAGQSRLARRELLAVAIGAAVLAGLAIGWALSSVSFGWASAGISGWATSGAGLAVAGLTVLLAVANGFSKAYSP